MPQITYVPTHDSPDQTEVSGIQFQAYQPVEVANRDLFEKLRRNPFFTEGAPDNARKGIWRAVRAAQAKAADLRRQADAIEQQARDGVLAPIEDPAPEATAEGSAAVN